MVLVIKKTLKMIKDETYKLSLSDNEDKHGIDGKLVKTLKSKIHKIVKNFDGYLIHKCNFKNFNGRDIDILYLKKSLIK